MYNLVLFCKSYIKDLDRIMMLKSSIDKYNADNIPFCIVCPQKDLSIFKEKLISGKESYSIYIYSDEEILLKLGIPSLEQSWTSQQIIKLGFYKMGICNHYSIIDSECYFIDNFYVSDFMYDEDTPYIYINVCNRSDEETLYIKNYFKRKGKYYNFVHNSQVFSKIVLEDMENNFLKKSDLTFQDLINKCPYEFNWYGEYFLKCKLLPTHLRGELVKVFFTMESFIDSRNKGMTIQDFINSGFKALLMQNRWVREVTYKPHSFYKLIKIYRQSRNSIYSDHKPKSFNKKIEYYCKNLVRENLKILLMKQIK